MYTQQVNHYEVVADTLAGRRKADERTIESVAVLEDRLERLKKLSSRFASISLSPDVTSLTARADVVLS
jgi:hypothetical protein